MIHEYAYPTASSGWGTEEHDAINRVVSSGNFTLGNEVERFEEEFARYHEMSYAVMVNSGSSANLVALAALNAGKILLRGEMVSVPALAWATTYAPAVQYGMNLELVDCDDGWNAVRDCDISVNILGNPATIGYTLLEDNCESIGARDTEGRLCGTRGLLNTFSFYWSHQLSAVEGGMILTNDADLARACRMLRNHGWTRGLRMNQVFEDEFRFEAMGYNVRPLELHAAIAREQLKKLDARIAARTRNYECWRAASSVLPIGHPLIRGTPSFFGIHFEVENSEVRTRLAKTLRANDIDCRPPVAGSLRKQPYGSRWSNQATPHADRIHDCGMMLGNPPFEWFGQIERAVRVMKETL